MKTFITALLYALDNIRTNFFHTILSVLGIIIGVSALVAMLSMIDGLEKFAEDQIQQTTAIKLVEVSSKRTVNIDGINIRKEHPVILTEEIHKEILETIQVPVAHYRVSTTGREILFGTERVGASVHYADHGYVEKYSLVHGHSFPDLWNDAPGNFAVINLALAKLIGGDSVQPENLIGETLAAADNFYEITGIAEGGGARPELLLPIRFLTESQIDEHPPFIIFEARHVEDVPAIRESALQWLNASPFNSDDIAIQTQDFRVEQAAKGFMLFRVVMGIIIGISIVVGGVGVMNVLLISVTQRTNEIGLRKAVGSRKKDIYIQFLTESMIVSLFGTLAGIIAGVLFTLAISPLVLSITEMDFPPLFTFSSIFAIASASLIIGIIFGTFPAFKASQLNPIDALRRE